MKSDEKKQSQKVLNMKSNEKKQSQKVLNMKSNEKKQSQIDYNYDPSVYSLSLDKLLEKIKESANKHKTEIPKVRDLEEYL